MPDKLDKQEIGGPAAATDSGAARVVTARRRLMLGVAAVLPSIVTLPSGARNAQQSFNCSTGRVSHDRFVEGSEVERFTVAPDEWLRKKVFSGRFTSNGRTAYCTTWEQPSVLAIARMDRSSSGYKALEKTTWSDGHDPVAVGEACPGRLTHQIGEPGSYCFTETVDNINPQPDYYGLVYVDETGLNCALERSADMFPVRASCWASLVGDRGSNLG